MKLKFLDVKTRKPFVTTKYKVGKDKRGRKRAVATSPSGSKAYRYI